MSVYPVKLPDVGEGVAEAELVNWLVKVGDHVTTESALAEVLTDKATVEIASPVAGVITFLRGEPGELIAVGTEIVGIEQGESAPGTVPAPAPPAAVAPVSTPTAVPPPPPIVTPIPAAAPFTRSVDGTRPTAAPAVRQRARSLGIDLHTVTGTGPDGRITHTDLDHYLAGDLPHAPAGTDSSGVHVEPIRGLRRRIATRLTEAWADIPHITYVDEVDATDLEAQRAELNRRHQETAPRLTILPFLVRAITIAVAEHPRLNAHYDSAAQTLSVFDAVHVGIATQTPNGLSVPVLRHAETRGMFDIASEINRLANAARDNKATLEELSGSTITITSLGALGGLVTTPLLNRPEVAIIGVNKMQIRPVWRDGTFVPRSMFNLSSSFDHRIIDGWDAATFVQRIKALLETPSLLFGDESL